MGEFEASANGCESVPFWFHRKPWKQLVLPAVRLARDGFNATEYLGQCVQSLFREL